MNGNTSSYSSIGETWTCRGIDISFIHGCIDIREGIERYSIDSTLSDLERVGGIDKYSKILISKGRGIHIIDTCLNSSCKGIDIDTIIDT